MRKLNSVLVCISTSLILSTFLVAPTRAANVIDADANGHLTPRYPEWNIFLFTVSLEPVPAEHIPRIFSRELDRARDVNWGFPDWSWIRAVDPAPGEFRVIHYDADVDRALPNLFRVDYVSGDPNFPHPGYVLQWIQFVYTNDPVPGDPSPALDPTTWGGVKNWEDNLPFYWTEPERQRNSAGGSDCPAGVDITFRDRPSRHLQEAPVDWWAHLYLVEWDRGTTVLVHDGIEWGFNIRGLCGPGRDLNVSGGVAGNKFDTYGVHYGNSSFPQIPCEVGGIVVPVDKFALLTPYVALAIAVVAVTIGAVYARKRWFRKTVVQKP